MHQEEKKRGIEIEESQSKEEGFTIGQSWFLGIGINEYQHFHKLNNAVKDVCDLLSLLEERYEIDQKITLLNKEATRENIINRLEEMVDLAATDDKIIIYYSGHGFLHHKETGYWIPVDAEQGKRGRYILNETIRAHIKSIRARHILLISDSCFSGSLLVTRDATRSYPDKAFAEWEKNKSRWVLSSGRQAEKVADGPPGQNSPFATSILKVLRDNTQPKLNVAALADKVVKLTSYNWEQTPQGSPLFGVGDELGQYVFCLKNVSSDRQKARKHIPSQDFGQNGQFTDPRDGHIYKTIRFNGKTWMAQNLNFDLGEDCWFYNNNPELSEKYGRLYTWEAAQKACPPGWHLPTDEDWKKLLSGFGGYYDGDVKRSFGNPRKAYEALVPGGNSAFAALLGGWLYFPPDNFGTLGSNGYYWSSTEKDASTAWYCYFISKYQRTGRASGSKTRGCSCRCLKD